MDRLRAIERVDRAELNAYVALYTAAAHLDCGWLERDGIHVVWSARDEDPGFSCVMNLGDAPDPGAALDVLEPAAKASGSRRIGVDTPPALAAWATEQEMLRRGFVPDYDEFIVAAEISAARPEVITSPGLRVERVTDPAQLEVFAQTLNVGYDVAPDHARGYVFGATIGMDDWYHYLVWIDEQPASASVLFVTEGVADLYVATTVPKFRGRGAQNALIARRLADAYAAGCDLATSQVIVSNSSPRNMLRNGFEVLYRRTIWGKEL